MTALRIINVVIWGALLLYLLPGAWSAVHGKAVRRGDPMRLGCVATAFVMLGFFLRWLLAPESDLLWQALHILSAADAVYIWFLARAYGRGEHV